MDIVLRIGAYVIVGVVLLALNGLFVRRVYYEFHRSEPSPVVAPFRIVGAKDDPERGKVLAQMLIARVDRLNKEMSESMKVLGRSSAGTDLLPADLLIESFWRDFAVRFDEYEPIDVQLSFGGVELGGLVTWAQKLGMSDRMVSISVRYDGPKTTLSMTPNRSAGDSLWLELNNANDRELITDLAHAFVQRGWNEEIQNLTLEEFKTLTKLIHEVAKMKLAGDRLNPEDHSALNEDIDRLLKPHSRAWESQTILQVCAVISAKAGNKSRASELYARIIPKTQKEESWLRLAKASLGELSLDPRITNVLIAMASTQPAAVKAAHAAAPTPKPSNAIDTPPESEPAPKPAPTPPEPSASAVAAFVRALEPVVTQLHVPDEAMEREPVVAIVGPNPDRRVGPFESLHPSRNQSDQMTEYSTSLVETLRLVAPACRVVFANAEPLTNDRLLEAIDHVQSTGAKILLLTYGPLGAPLEKAIAQLADRGVLIVAAAGNRPGEAPHFAAESDRVLVVSAVDRAGQPAFFTQSDEESVWAPGTDVLIKTLDGQVAERSGTSYAAALAAGVAARVLAANPNLAPKDVVSLLRRTSAPVASGGPPLLNVENAVRAARENS